MFRGNIGVVPQDTVLFNESIMYNLSYGKIGVTQAFMYFFLSASKINERTEIQESLIETGIKTFESSRFCGVVSFFRILTVPFILFLAPLGGSNPAGQS